MMAVVMEEVMMTRMLLMTVAMVMIMIQDEEGVRE